MERVTVIWWIKIMMEARCDTSPTIRKMFNILCGYISGLPDVNIRDWFQIEAPKE